MNRTEALYAMSTRDFALLGIEGVAYVKVVQVDGRTAFAVHAADGTPMAMLDDREIAFATIRQHDMEPVSVH